MGGNTGLVRRPEFQELKPQKEVWEQKGKVEGHLLVYSKPAPETASYIFVFVSVFLTKAILRVYYVYGTVWVL